MTGFAIAKQAGCAALTAAAVSMGSWAGAITLGQVDDFSNGTVMDWQGNQTFNVLGEGQLGPSDRVLRIDSFQRMVARNDTSFPANVPAQWAGNYTGAGVTQLSMDVKNPNTFDLKLFLGIAAFDAGGFVAVNSGGGGDTYITNYSITVPADDAWHKVSFSITAADFVEAVTNDAANPAGPAGTLNNVAQLRILHSTVPGEFRGDEVSGHFFVDNITAEAAAMPEDADFNGDGDVDGADFLAWQRGFGTGTTLEMGDADANGVVDAVDLGIWKAQFGVSTAAVAVAAIPEPAAAGLAAIALGMCAGFRRRMVDRS
jgi:hypothetical protein